MESGGETRRGVGRPKAAETFEQFSLRVPKGTLDRLRRLAQADDRPTANMARRALLRGLDVLERELKSSGKRR